MAWLLRLLPGWLVAKLVDALRDELDLSLKQPEQLSSCLLCGVVSPLSGLVYVNHCYHADRGYPHYECAGMRLLCESCHRTAGTVQFYLVQLERQALACPGKYPWDCAREGLIKYLTGGYRAIVRHS